MSLGFIGYNVQRCTDSTATRAAGAPQESATWYALSPTIALPSLALAFAYILMFFADTSFATATNLCFVAISLQKVVASSLQKQSSAKVLGLTAATPTLYALVGASSFSFHTSGDLGTAAHSFDILFGVLLVLHVCYVTVTSCVYWLTAMFFPTRKAAAAVVMSCAYIISVFFVVLYYDSVYWDQKSIYVCLAALTAACYAPLRAKLACAWVFAIKETVVITACLVSAVYSQCELVGTSCRDEYYDFYHGQWHLLNGVVTSIVYTRIAHVLPLIDSGSKICEKSIWIDRVGLAILFMYAVAVVILKETQVHLDMAKMILWVFCVFLCAHGVATAVWYVRTAKCQITI